MDFRLVIARLLEKEDINEKEDVNNDLSPYSYLARKLHKFKVMRQFKKKSKIDDLLIREANKLLESLSPEVCPAKIYDICLPSFMLIAILPEQSPLPARSSLCLSHWHNLIFTPLPRVHADPPSLSH